MLNNKNILIIGGTGSFGKKASEIILKNYNPKKLIIYSRDEMKQNEMSIDPLFKKFNRKLRFFIGDVRDLKRLQYAMFGVDIVIHAAALKHVHISEYNPIETIKTNIIGAQNVIEASIHCNVKKVIALSTDKASSPANLYGATKLCSDKLFIAANNFTGGKDIKFSVVRYGNVMGSRGSVIPFFLECSKSNIFPITDKRMTRFNITLDEGVKFVINCFDIMWGGEIFVPKLKSYKILDVVHAISKKPKIKIVGIRPGEKIDEQMISSDDSLNTIEYNKFYSILPPDLQFAKWSRKDFFKNKLNKKASFCKEGFRYESGKNNSFLSVSEIRYLIKKNLKV